MLNFLRTKKFTLSQNSEIYRQVLDEFDYFCIPVPNASPKTPKYSIEFPKITEEIDIKNFTSTNSKFFIILRENHVAIWDLEHLQKFQIHTNPQCEIPTNELCVDATVGKNGKGIFLVYNFSQSRVFQWEIETGKFIKFFKVRKPKTVNDVSFRDGFFSAKIKVNHQPHTVLYSVDGEECVFKGDWNLGNSGTVLRERKYIAWKSERGSIPDGTITVISPPLIVSSDNTIQTVLGKILYTFSDYFDMEGSNGYVSAYEPTQDLALIFIANESASFVGGFQRTDCQIYLSGSYLVGVYGDHRTLEVISLDKFNVR